MEKVIKKLDKILKEVKDAKADKKSISTKAEAIKAIKKAKLFLADVEIFVKEVIEEPAEKEVKEEAPAKDEE